MRKRMLLRCAVHCALVLVACMCTVQGVAADSTNGTAAAAPAVPAAPAPAAATPSAPAPPAVPAPAVPAPAAPAGPATTAAPAASKPAPAAAAPVSAPAPAVPVVTAPAAIPAPAQPRCRPDLLKDGVLFDRANPRNMTNAYLMLLLARYAYPTAFGMSSTSEATQATYKELYRRKFGALGARVDSIAFVNVDAPGPALLTSQPEAHAVVFATDSDVFVSFRGLTNIDSALSPNSRFTPVEGSFGGERVLVHGGFYSSFAAAWPGVAAAMQKAVAATAKPDEAAIFLAGHSMGAAHALFAALRLTDMHKPVGGVFLYGAPKVGQQAFVDLFEASGLEDRTFAWWNEMDLVPNMNPPVRDENKYSMLPESTLYRIWEGRCAKADGDTALPCPLGDRRCRFNLQDHFAFTYVVELQNCLMVQPQISGNPCLLETVMATM